MSLTPTEGKFAIALESDLSTRILGGPFEDIDDLLDRCWDEVMASGRKVESLFFAERRQGDWFVQIFPPGVFPTEGVGNEG